MAGTRRSGAATTANNDRIRPKLKGLSPVQYRTQPLNLPSL
ncbi:IS3 family transposase [Rhizobium beringeri]